MRSNFLAAVTIAIAAASCAAKVDLGPYKMADAVVSNDCIGPDVQCNRQTYSVKAGQAKQVCAQYAKLCHAVGAPYQWKMVHGCYDYPFSPNTVRAYCSHYTTDKTWLSLTSIAASRAKNILKLAPAGGDSPEDGTHVYRIVRKPGE